MVRRVASHPGRTKNKICQRASAQESTDGHLAKPRCLAVNYLLMRKASGVNLEEKSTTYGPHRHRPSLLGHGRWITGVKGGVNTAQIALHLKNPLRRQEGHVHSVTSPISQSPVATGKGRKRQVEDVTGSRNSNPACRRFRILVACCWLRDDSIARQHPERPSSLI